MLFNKYQYINLIAAIPLAFFPILPGTNIYNYSYNGVFIDNVEILQTA